MRHVILGNGAAGIMAAGKLRELDSTCAITVVSNESTPVYTKCMLPDYVGGKLAREKLFIRDFDFYRENRIDLRLDQEIRDVDLKSKVVTLGEGITLPYDKLLIAIGGIPFIPKLEGLEPDDYSIINSIFDADQIIDRAFEGGKALILGAGLTGIEMGFALKRRGMEVCIIEREDRILPQQLDLDSSYVVVERMKQEGMKFELGKTLEGIVREGGRKFAKLSDGQEIPFDFIVMSVGTRPNLALFKDTGLECRRGLLVDEFMKTSVEDVYAAGDVAEMLDTVSNEYVSSYIWPNAMAQGTCAAHNMAGQSKAFSCSAMMNNAVQLRDMPFFSMGLINPKGEGYEKETVYEKEKGVYKKVVVKGNEVKGMIFLGDTKNANLIAGLIRKGTDVSKCKHRLLEPDFSKDKV